MLKLGAGESFSPPFFATLKRVILFLLRLLFLLVFSIPHLAPASLCYSPTVPSFDDPSSFRVSEPLAVPQRPRL